QLEKVREHGSLSQKKSTSWMRRGMEVAVCRHGVLLRSLNMMRGEILFAYWICKFIFAYPMCLQKELTPRNVQFMCTDVICKYWPYLHRVVKAGTTLGEEVKQVNSFL
ncbi:hypothetical protein QQF64_027222, partial [Cirrhinus molitorella]